MSTYILYIITAILVAVSFSKDRQKTKMALKKGWKSFNNILPELLGVMMLVGVLMALLNPAVISKVIGAESGWLGIIISAVVGAVTLIPGFIAFPTADVLLQQGAGYMQIGAFISTLMMVGVLTLPVEVKYFGRNIAILRNSSAFVFSFFVAYIIGKVVGGL